MLKSHAAALQANAATKQAAMMEAIDAKLDRILAILDSRRDEPSLSSSSSPPGPEPRKGK